MYVSNDRSRHGDQFCPKIVKIGVILAFHSQSFSDIFIFGCGLKTETKEEARKSYIEPDLGLQNAGAEPKPHDSSCSSLSSFAL